LQIPLTQNPQLTAGKDRRRVKPWPGEIRRSRMHPRDLFVVFLPLGRDRSNRPGAIKKRSDHMQEYAKPNARQKQLIRKRGLNPANYTVLKELNYSLFLVDIRDKTIKILDKRS
jgi:hypothetical protein